MANSDVLDKKLALARFLDIEDELKENAEEELVTNGWGDSEEFSEEDVQARFEELLDEEIEQSKYNDNEFSYGRQEYLICTDDEADDEFNENLEQLWDVMGLEAFSGAEYIVEHFADEKSFWKDSKSDIENWIEESPDSYSSFFDIDEMKDDILKDIKKNDVDSDYFDALGLDEDNEDFHKYDSEGESIDWNYKAIEDEAEDAINNLSDDEVLNMIKDNGDISNYSSDACENYIDQYTPYSWLQEMGYEGKDLVEQLSSYLDKQDIFDYVKKSDGRGPTLASYNGEEQEIKGNDEDYYLYRRN
jgi:hypothetical protein